MQDSTPNVLAAALAAALLNACAPAPPPVPAADVHTRVLDAGWRLHAADGLPDGEQLSQASFGASGWPSTAVPSTVLAALAAAGIHEDLYFARNLENLDTAGFAGPWWYRTEFHVDEAQTNETQADDTVRHALVFEGVNYSAEVFVNGRRVASRDEVRGAYRQFELDVTDHVQAGANVLAVQVFPPEPGDFTLGFVDWNPEPPDRNMGLWRGVRLRTTGPVSLADVFVSTELDDTLDEASLRVAARVRNHGGERTSVRLHIHVDGRVLAHDVELDAGEEVEVVLTAADHPELLLENPRLWWPAGLGEPALYELALTASAGGGVSDARTVRFGVRTVGDYMTADGYRGYTVNGKEVLIRGGGWVNDLLLADTDDNLAAQVAYAKHMGLNTLRLEGFWGTSQRLYDLADENGLLVMPGWSCQWEWTEYLGGEVDDYGGVRTPEQIDLVARSLVDQVTWLRNHPSIFVWVLASDMLPRPALEKRYRDDLASIDPSRPVLAACSVRTSEVSGPTGVKMNGPYDFVPPSYWYLDTERGGAYGFNTETGPGPQPPPLESLRRMLPEESLWPIDEMWDYHSGRHQFATIGNYKRALDERYGPSSSVEEFAMKSQVQSYEAMRAMFESFAVRRTEITDLSGAAVERPRTTGLIQWMLNSAWPEMYWQLYDHYLMPNGAFYGTKTATEPLNLVYAWGEDAIYAVNETASSVRGTFSRRLVDVAGREIANERLDVELAAESTVLLGELGAFDVPVAFLDLRLEDDGGKVLARDFYWLPREGDVLDPEASEWYVTPTKTYADLTALAELPPVDLAVDVRPGDAKSSDTKNLSVTLRNDGDAVAFFVELRVVDEATDMSFLPVFWEDNYVSLLPGEERALNVRVEGLDDGPAVLAVAGWNVAARRLPLPSP